jgi:acylphosphatase
MKLKALKIIVHGKVQGVYFRKYTEQIAKSLQLNGFVRNAKDGTVYIEACGDEEALKKLVAWCNKGPERASIDKVEIIEIAVNDFHRFEIRKTE